LLDQLVRLAPWPVDWLDPAPAIARRVMDLIGPAAPNMSNGTARAIFTSGREPPPTLAAALAQFGIVQTAVGVGVGELSAGWEQQKRPPRDNSTPRFGAK
jgi:glutamate racemase